MNDILQLPIHGIAELIRAGSVTASEVVARTLDRIERTESVYHHFVTVFGEQATAEAARADEELADGHHRGPLHGLPVGLKDIIEFRETTCGSALMMDYTSERTATVVTRLREAGAIIIGKHNTYEFAAGAQALEGPFPPAANPWDTGRETGGSSSGSAASVAVGTSYASIGTDTGASIRFPAFCCGVVGLKPSFGRVSRHGVYPLSWTCDHVGVLARRVRDAFEVLQVIAGPDPQDPCAADVDVPDFSFDEAEDLRGLRVGVIKDLLSPTAAVSARNSFDSATQLAADNGAEIVEVAGPSMEDLNAIFWSITLPETAHIHLDNLRHSPNQYTPRMRQQALLGHLIASPQHLRAHSARRQLQDDMAAILPSMVDVLLMPTSGFSSAPPYFETPPGLSSLHLDGPRFTILANLIGAPAIQMPSGFDDDDRPVGFQIVGAPLQEPVVARVARVLEDALALTRVPQLALP